MKIVEATYQDFEVANFLFKELDEYHVKVDPGRIRSHDDLARTEDEYKRYIEGDSNTVFLSYIGQNSVALANVTHQVIKRDRYRVGREFVLLDNLFVSEQYRRQGVASALFKHVQNWSLSRGVRNLEIQVYANNIAAQEFYKSLGFSTYFVRMEMQLNAYQTQPA